MISNDFAFDVLGAHRGFLGALTGSRKPGMLRQPSSPVCLPSFAMTSGIDQNDSFRLLRLLRPPAISMTVIRLPTSICGRGQPDAMRSIHGFEHVLDELMQFGRVEFRRPGRPAVRESDCSDIGRPCKPSQKFRTCSM